MRPQTLAIITTGLGDTVLCTPALAALGAVHDLDVLVHQHRLPLLQGNPAARRLVPYRNNALFRLQAGMRLGRTHYDHLLVLHANDDILGLLPRLRYAQGLDLQGWDDPGLRLAYHAPKAAHWADQRLELAGRVGAGVEGEAPPLRVYLEEAELAWGQAWLEGRGLGEHHFKVALCPGGADSYKLWPAAGFGGVASSLEKCGARVVVVGSLAEGRLAEEVASAARRPLARALGLGLRRLAGILAGCDLLISNDTGPMHLSQAVGTPVLAIFGGTDPATYGPRDPRSRYLRPDLPCETCLKRQCPRPRCLEALEPGRVITLAREMLDRLDESCAPGEA